MNRFKILVAVFAFSLLAFALPETASAQWRDNRRNDDDYYGNNRYPRNDNIYGNSGYNRNLQSTIKNLKNHSKQFEKRIDRELDRSRYDERRREDQINNLAASFARAADDLDDAYGNGRNRNNNYVQSEANRVLQLGSQLDRALNRSGLSNNVYNDWNRIRRELQILSNSFGGYYNNNNRNNRNNRNNDTWRNRIPFPFPF